MQNFTDDILQAPDTEFVCYCHKVTKAEIVQAIQQGANNLEKIQNITFACTGGLCKQHNPRGR